MVKTSKQLTPHKKAVILELNSMGVSRRTIAKRLRFGETSVRSFLHCTEDGVIDRKKGSGRPRISNEEEDDVLVNLCLDDRFKTALELQPEWNEGAGVLASKDTINRRLRENYLPARRPRKKPLAKESTQAKRLAFARRHRRWSKKDWSCVIFSDETWVQMFENGGKRFVRRMPGEELQPECILPTIKHPPKVMVWGAITPTAKSKLVFIDGNVDADKYIEILKEANLKRFISRHPDPEPLVMEDGAGAHRAKKTQEWHRKNGINVLPNWPGFSPDMNPIENCWSQMKRALSKEKPTTLDGVKQVMQKIWNELSLEYLQKLFASMPRRMKAVIDANGGPTKY